MEPAQQAALPADDPRAKLNEDEQVAKAAADKIFEIHVFARRAKKEKLAKLEEEAKANPDAQPQPQDPDMLDAMVQLVDYPNTVKEAQAFSKFAHTVQGLFVINFLNQAPQEEDETVEASQREAYPMEVSEAEQASTDKTKDKLQQLTEARANSDKGSALRNLCVVPLNFEPYIRVEFKQNDQGEEVETPIEPEPKFQLEVMTNLEKYGALFIKYQRFKEKVMVVPLMPDKAALNEMMNLEQLNKDYEFWLTEAEKQVVQDSMTQSQKDLLDPSA